MKRSIKIVTAIALTAGIVVGAAAYGKHQFGSPDRRASVMINIISEELDLNSTQEQALVALKDELLVTRELLHEQMQPAKDEIVTLLAADSFDQTRVLEIINEKTAALNQAAPGVVAAFGNFLDGLDAEQKAEIARMKEHRGEHRGRWHDHD